MERIATSHSTPATPLAYGELADRAFAIELAFAAAADLDGRYVFVSSHGSAVTLSGWVSTNAEKTLAANIAGRVPGVGSVDNKLDVLL